MGQGSAAASLLIPDDIGLETSSHLRWICPLQECSRQRSDRNCEGLCNTHGIRQQVCLRVSLLQFPIGMKCSMCRCSPAQGAAEELCAVLKWMCWHQMVSSEQRGFMTSLVSLLVLEMQTGEWRFPASWKRCVLYACGRCLAEHSCRKDHTITRFCSWKISSIDMRSSKGPTVISVCSCESMLLPLSAVRLVVENRGMHGRERFLFNKFQHHHHHCSHLAWRMIFLFPDSVTRLWCQECMPNMHSTALSWIMPIRQISLTVLPCRVFRHVHGCRTVEF